jgi:2-polyprenyl-3-methyl-5-hydroxy-6-metoxy-1,4-benzoquinol methylase
VAVLQQIPTSRRRQALLRALHKNLKPNGLFIATTWNLWQKKYFWPLAQSFFKKNILSLALGIRRCLYPLESYRPANLSALLSCFHSLYLAKRIPPGRFYRG